MRRANSLLLIILVGILALLASCDMDTVYYHYSHTPVQGWEKNDTLTFDIAPTERPGKYALSLGVRVNADYPFTKLSLIVEQAVFSGKGKAVPPSRDSERITFNITTNDGDVEGGGLSYYQYELPLEMSPTLAPGDSIHYSVRHNMKRSILPGITDVGIKLMRLP